MRCRIHSQKDCHNNKKKFLIHIQIIVITTTTEKTVQSLVKRIATSTKTTVES